MSENQGLSFFIAYAAGVLSFLSPCVLPLVPSYVAFITGLSFEELTQEQPKSRLRWIVMSHSVLFILGFSTLFTALGASASLIGQFLAAHRDTIRIVGGILIILFGLLISGVISLNFLQQEKKFHIHNKTSLAFRYSVAVVFIEFFEFYNPRNHANPRNCVNSLPLPRVAGKATCLSPPSASKHFIVIPP